MSLLTRCPQCHTTFRISEEMLRKAAGQVRCGRCANIFNAHVELRDSEEAPKARPAPASASTKAEPRDRSQIDETSAAPEPRLRAVLTSSDSSAPKLGDAGAPADAANRGGDLGARSDFSLDSLAGTDLDPASEPDASPPTAAELWTLTQVASGPDRSRLWKLGAALAGLLLLVQVANSFSDVLATRVPFVRSVYAALGVTLVPRWDLDRYEVLGATATTNPGASGRGNLVITARIRNRGTLAQPYPQVQLRLLDRWERTVGRRAFAPADYGPTSISPDAMLAPGASITAELVVVDPGPDAAGFEIDVCVDGSTGLRCDRDDVFE
jgi:predicted Zn finger-like uncharacterized protein